MNDEAVPQPEPLSLNPVEFWSGMQAGEDQFGEVRLPPISAPLVRRLGSFPFWRYDIPLLDAVEPVYNAASARGLDVFLGVGLPVVE